MNNICDAKSIAVTSQMYVSRKGPYKSHYIFISCNLLHYVKHKHIPLFLRHRAKPCPGVVSIAIESANGIAY